MGHWFRDLSTRRKLVVGFGLMGVLLTLIAGLGLSAAAGANGAFDTAYNRDIKGVELAQKARYDFVLIAREYMLGMLDPDPAKKDGSLRSWTTSSATPLPISKA